MGSWLRAIRLPLVLAAANFFVWPLAARVIPGSVANAGFNAVRIGLMVWAGALVTRRGAAGLRGAAFAGAAVMVVDHIILKGGTFLLYAAFGPTPPNYTYLQAFGGVVISFVMFSPIAALAGLCGGLYGRRSRVSHAV